MNLKEAYLFSKNYYRSTSGLKVDQIDIFLKDISIGKSVCISSQVSGGEIPHSVRLAFPLKKVKKGHKLKVRGKNITCTVDSLNSTTDYECWVHCDCEDFRFTFWPWIKRRGYSLGEFPKYTPKNTRPPRHVTDFGLCKHLMCTVKHLRELSIVS